MCALALAALAAVVPGISPASANLGTPVAFDPAKPQAFLVQGATGGSGATYVLQHAQVQPNGTVVYVNEGTIGAQVNGIGFNSADGFVYGTTLATETPANTLIRIGQNGVYQVVKTPGGANCTLPGPGNYLSGTIVNGFYYAYIPANSTTNSFVMQKVDLSTCTRTTYTVTGLSNPPATVNLPFDLTFADGFFWGINANGFLVRIPTSAGPVQYTNVSSIVPSGNPYGAAWTMGNGNPVFQNNGTGDFFQLDTTPAATGGTPVLISRVTAPTNSQNDGTFIPGNPVDLAISKQGAASYQAPQSFTYTFTVTNNGPGDSSGAIVQDRLPAGETFSSSSVACFDYGSGSALTACASGDTNLGFSIPAIAPNATFTYTVTVNIASGTTGKLTNNATIIPNEADTNSANNTSSTSATIPLTCTANPIYGLNQTAPFNLIAINSTTGISTPVASFATPPAGKTGFAGLNALAIAPGGSAAYVTQQEPTLSGSVQIQKYDPSTGATSVAGSITVATGISHIIGGAFDPTTGYFWIMGYNSTTLRYEFYAFNTTTNTSLGLQFTYPFSSSVQSNGDLAFDATGRLYVLMNDGSSQSKIVTFGPPTPSGNLSASQGTVLIPIVDPVNVQANGVAFGADGYLYTEGNDGPGGQRRIRKIDPATGNVVATVLLTNSDGTANALSADLGSCTSPSTITLRKNIVGRKVATDQFGLSITGNGLNVNNTATTSGSTTGLQTTPGAVAGPVLAIPGATYTITETGSSGANLANYATTYQCVDTLNNNAVVASGSAAAGSVTMPAPSANGANVVCTFTNTPLSPAISLTKTPDRSTLVAGQTVTYTFVARNTGNTTLSNVQISEGAFNGLGGSMSPLTGCTPALGSSLAPNATMTCTATYVVSQADVDRYAQNGMQLTNAASVVGTPPSGANVTASASASIPSVVSPAIRLTKSAGAVTDVDGNGTDAGDTIVYSFSVRNSGNVTLDPVTVADPLLAGQGITISCPAGPLAPGLTVSCTASGAYTLTQGDVDAGSVSNTATATGTTPSGGTVTDPSSTSTPLAGSSAISLTKTPNRTTLVAGQTITYTFVARNTGATTLTNVQISEGAFNGLGGAMSPLTGCTPALGSSLAPNATMTCTATYVVSQADVDRYAQNGMQLTNAASVVGTLPSGANVTANASASIPSTSAPAIDLTKSAGAVTDVDGNGTDAGDTIVYSFSVRNSGNVTLDPVTVADPLLAGQGITISCPAGPLAPGLTVSCTASGAYTLTQGDVDAGSVSNTATATGTTPSGGTVTDPSSTSTPLAGSSAISLTKTPNRTTLVAGQTITYTFVARNTGATTLTNVQISEGAFNGLGGAMSPLTGCTPALGSSLAPNATMTCTATYVVSQADVDRYAQNGTRLNNGASVVGSPADGSPDVTASANASIPSTSAPAIDLTKSAGAVTDVDGNGTDAGDTIVYSFSVRNSGNVTLDPVTVADPLLAGQGITISCPAGPLAPGLTVSCTASGAYTLTQGDVDAGSVSNTATATGTTPGGQTPTDPSTTTTPLSAVSSIKLTKTADKTTLVVGETITYSFLVENTGATTLSNVTVSETSFTGSGSMSAISCPGTMLAPGVSMTCTATYVVTQADVDAFDATGVPVTNTAHVVGTPPSGPDVTDDSQASVPAVPAPAIDLTKSAGAVTDVDGNGTDAGDTIVYSFSVRNSGNVTLDPVTVADPLLAGQGITISCPAGPLAPGLTVSCTASGAYTLTQGDVDAGSVSNTATATGTTPGGQTPTDPSTTTTPLTPTSSISLTKTADKTTLVVGETITYSFLVENTGATTLSNVTVSETSFTGSGSMSAISCPGTMLAPGVSMTCTATYVVTQADVDAFDATGVPVTNTAHVVGTPPSGPDVTDDSQASVPAVPAPAIDLTKSAGAVTDVDGNGTDAGDTIVYSFSVRNSGNVTLDPVTVADPLLAGQGITISCPAGPLAPGLTVSCTASGAYTLTQGDVDAGSVSNTATATGTTPGGQTPTDPSTTTTPLTPTSSISLTKTADKTTLVVGETITYSFLVENTGATTLSNVTVSETSFTGSGSMSAISCPGTMLAPGVSMTCTATYVVTQADVDAFDATGVPVTNTAHVVGTPPSGPDVTDDSQASVPAVPAPAIDLTKSAGAVTDVDGNGTDAGDTIVYSFSVRNSGNVTLDPVTVADPLLAGQGITISCPAGPLAPGVTVSCTASGAYTLTQGDVDAGSVSNTATATGTTPGGQTPTDPSTTTTPLTPTSSISLTKTADKTTLVVGETITYTFVATNTGATTLTDVQISETSFNGLGTAPVVTGCSPAQGTTLAPGATMTCTATYVVTQGDVDAFDATGVPVTNTAHVVGTPPSGPPVTDTADATVPFSPDPKLALDKKVASVDDVNGNGLTDAGDEIHYEFLVSNAGNVTISSIAVSDPMLPIVVCEAVTLAPGASTVCRPHATYVITQADVDAGGVHNVATATGTTPGGTPVEPPKDQTFTPSDRKPGLNLAKKVRTVMDMNGNGVVDQGDEVTYEFVASNVGTVTLTGVSVKDPKLAASGITVSCPAGPLLPGASVTCVSDAPYVVTAADVAAGGVHNVATVSARPPGGQPIGSTPSHANVPTEKKCTPSRANRGSAACPKPPVSYLPDTGMPRGIQWLGVLAVVMVGSGGLLIRRARR